MANETVTSVDSNLQSWSITLIRAIVGVVFLMHGGQKLFVWGGTMSPDFSGSWVCRSLVYPLCC